MRKFLSLLVVFGMVTAVTAIPDIADALTTADFDITVTVLFMEMQIVGHEEVWGGTAYSTWAIGSIATSSTDNTMTQAQGVKVVLGTTSQTLDIQSHVSAGGGNWTVAATAGIDEFAIMAKGYDATQASPSVTGGTQLTDSALDVIGATAVALGADTWLYYDFHAPTEVSTGGMQTITITVAVTAS